MKPKKFLAIIEVADDATTLWLDKDETIINTGGFELKHSTLKEMASFVKDPQKQGDEVIELWKKISREGI